MRRLRSACIAVAALLLMSLILGCMEETGTQEEDQSYYEETGGGGAGGGDTTGAASPPVDVEVTNIRYEWHEYPDQPLSEPVLTATCDAINYGGPGYVTVVLVVNGTNQSACMEQRIQLAQNEQRSLTFYRKFSCRPTSVTAHTKRGVLVNEQPTSGEPEVEIANLWYETLSWLDVERTQLEIAIHASAINYGRSGYVTVSIEIECQGSTSKVEQRVHLAWNEQVDLRLVTVVPSPSLNLTAYVRRPQAD